MKRATREILYSLLYACITAILLYYLFKYLGVKGMYSRGNYISFEGYELNQDSIVPNHVGEEGLFFQNEPMNKVDY